MDIYDPFGQNKKKKKSQIDKKLYGFIALGFTIVLIFSIIFMVKQDNPLGGEEVKSTTANEDETEITALPESDNYYLFWVNDADNKELEFLWIARLKMPKGILEVYSPSTQDLITEEDSSYRIGDYYSLYGPKQFADALEKNYGIKFANYMGSTAPMFRQMVNNIGGVQLDVKHQINYSDKFNLVLGKGENYIKGELLYRYLCYVGFADEFELSDRSEVLIDIFESVFVPANSSKINSLFSQITNNMISNITIVTLTEKSDELDYLYQHGLSSAKVEETIENLKRG